MRTYLKLLPRPRLLGRLLFVVAITALLAPFPGSGNASAATVTGNGTSCVSAPVSSSFPRTTTGSVSRTLAMRCFLSPTDSTNDAMRTRITDGNQSGETIDVAAIHSGTNSVALQTATSVSFTGLKWGLLTNSNSSTIAASDASLPDDYFEADVTYTWNWGGNTRTENSHVIVVLFGRTLAAGTQQHVVTCNTLLAPDPSSYGAAPCARSGAADETWRRNGADLNDWGDPYVYVSNRCENVKIAVEYQGDALTVADYDDTLYPANGSDLRDDFVFVATFPGWNYLDEPDGVVLSYRWPGNALWSPLFDILDRTTFNSGDDSAYSFRIGTSTARFLSQVQWRCIDNGADGAENIRSRFLPFWDPGTSINDPAWQELAQYLNPCKAITISPQAGEVAPGAVGRVPYSLATSTGITELDVFAYGVTNFLPTAGAAEVSSTSALGVATGGPSPLTWAVAPGSGFLKFTLPSTVAEPVAYSDLVFACSDSVESGLIIAGSADLGIVGSLDDEQQGRLTVCFEFEGMKLTSPATWVRGIGQMFTCLTRELTVPDGETLWGHVEAFDQNVGDKPPWVVFSTLIVFADDVNDAFQASSGSGCFDSGGVVGVTTDTDVCAGDGLNVQTSQRSTMAVLFTAPMLLGLAGHMLGLIRGEPDFITEPNGQMRMNF